MYRYIQVKVYLHTLLRSRFIKMCNANTFFAQFQKFGKLERNKIIIIKMMMMEKMKLK